MDGSSLQSRRTTAGRTRGSDAAERPERTDPRGRRPFKNGRMPPLKLIGALIKGGATVAILLVLYWGEAYYACSGLQMGSLAFSPSVRLCLSEHVAARNTAVAEYLASRGIR